jgi:uncharacterized protein YcbK (DUF882 family)
MYDQEERVITRRKMLKLGLLTAATIIIPKKTVDAASYLLPNTRSLSIYNAHTKEYFNSVYWEDGQYILDALKAIEYMFRDHYNGAEKTIDIKLVNLLYAMQVRLKTSEPFHLISGYRSPGTNARLRKRMRGVAKYSLHMSGKAADIRLPGHSLKKVRRAAYELKAGGVGYYPRSRFVHVDVGKLRYW